MGPKNITMRLRSVKKSQVMFLVIAVVAWVALLTLHGLLPHMSNAPSTYISSLGSIECGVRQPLELLQAKCTLMGGAAASSIPQSLPFYIPAVFILKVLPISVATAYAVIAAGVMAAALLGSYKLFSLAAKSRYVALFGGFVYLISPLIFSMRNFGGTYWAFLLLPLFLFLAWKLIRVNINPKAAGYIRPSLVIAAWCLWATTLLFLDGYSFVMCAIATYIVLGASFIKYKGQRFNTLIQALMVFAGLIFAYLIYTALLPTGSFGKSSIDLFRAMGLDVVTIFVPTNGTWLASLLHAGASWSKLWGDGSNTNNYMGIFLLLASLGGLYYSIKKTKLSGLKLAIIVIGVFGFIFALGPAIKIDSQKPVGLSLSESYKMPSGNAPTDPAVATIDRYAPGFSTMRATYRWFVLTEISIIFFAMIGLEALNTKKYRVAMVGFSVLIVLDLIPTPKPTISANLDRYDQNQNFNTEVITPLAKLVKPGQEILIYPDAAGNNDYLANYMAPMLDIRTYNVGDDKAVNNARKQWPGPILDLLLHPDFSVADKVRLIRMSFDQHDISMLIIPKFDLRWDSYAWPPRQAYPDRQELVQALLDTGKFQVKEYGRFFIAKQEE